jgi:hypothetical protein
MEKMKQMNPLTDEAKVDAETAAEMTIDKMKVDKEVDETEAPPAAVKEAATEGK